MSDGPAIEAAIVALAATHSLLHLYGDRHAATLRQANDAAGKLDVVRGGRSEVSMCLLPGKLVVGAVGHAPHAAGVAAIDRFLAQGISSITVSPGVNAVAVLDAVRALGQPSAAAPTPGPIRFGRAGVHGHGQEGATNDGALPGGAVLNADLRAHHAALRNVWAGLKHGKQGEIAPLVSLASNIAGAAAHSAGTILPMARLVDHDEYTFAHTVNVGLLASALAAEAGLAHRHIEEITIAALLHDIGKLHVPRTILSKNGALDPSERAIVMEHPASGAALLYGAPGLPRVAAMVAFEHHMNLDGTGYPHRKRGWRVTMASQIVHIADVFDALRTHRPYRPALDQAKALSILAGEANVGFDGQLFGVFVDRVVKRAA